MLFLPPYSPGLNPIEHCWAHLKARLKNFTGSVLSICVQISCYFGAKIQRV
ncbi:MAG: transposase [Puniceicoccales bacterium]|nr:transposase [Puniceicoccales bacterium]